MINREIGDGRDNRDWRRGGRDDSRGRPWQSNQVFSLSILFCFCKVQLADSFISLYLQQGPPPPLNSSAPVFIPRDGAPPRELHTASQRRDGHDHGRDRRDDVWERDRGGGSGPSRHHDRSYARPTPHTGSDGHDNRRGDDSGARRKRSRSPEPGEDTERDKRFKPASTSRNSSPPRGSSRSDRDRRPERKTRSGRH
jgi:hypothetical protein